MAEITRILEAIDEGDAHAAEELLPLVYDELRRLAAQKLSHEKPGQTLQATALVHEAYIRLVRSEDQNWDSRGHFFAAAAEAMRRVLLENARHKQRVRCGGGHHRIDLDLADLKTKEPSIDLIILDEALEKLASEDKQCAELVKLKYFAGLTTEQAAAVLRIPPRTAYRDWAYARSWLRLQMSTGDEAH
jgi:RNA polymerase sigma factor (TIGR02999 family)